MCFSQNQVLIIYPGIIKYIGNSKLKKKFNINASSEEVYNNYTDSDSVSVSKKNILGTFPLQISWYYNTTNYSLQYNINFQVPHCLFQ